jgi:cellulose synthase (UDP-forming)
MEYPAPINVRVAAKAPAAFSWAWLLVVAGLGALATALAIWPEELWSIGIFGWTAFTDWAHQHLLHLADESAPGMTLLPCVGMLGIALILRLLWNVPPNFIRLPVALLFLLIQVAYLVFRLSSTLSFNSLPDAVVGIGFFVSEALVHARIAIGNFSLLRVTDRSAEADRSEAAVLRGEYLPTVDVFIPTYSEPVELLRRTVVGCQAMDYPKKTIWLLDDTRRPQMRLLAQELGCRYLTRADNSHAKAGNLNHAMSESDGELFVVFDADFVPTIDFLARTVGFFCDPKVAMVQTPQNFYNEDAVTRNLGLDHALEDEQKLFFRALQPARDAANAIVCHGSCFVARRSAIDAIGGIPTETITEDWATSLRLQAAGYKLYYLNEALSAGLAADTCGEFIQQRARWAQGTLQGLFASTHPLHLRGLDWRQRFHHLASVLYYLGSAMNILTLVLPLFFLFGGVLIMEMSVSEILFYRMPFTIGYYFLYSWLTMNTRSAFWSEFYDAFLAPTMLVTVMRSLIRPFGVGFRVTNKARRNQHASMNWQLAAPFIVLLALHIIGIAFAIATRRHVEQPDTFWIVSTFAAFNVCTLWMCVLVCIDIAHTSSFRRLPRHLPYSLTWDDGFVEGRTDALSDDEAIVPASHFHGEPPRRGELNLPTLGFDRVSVRIVQDQRAGHLLLCLPELALPQYRALIAELYCKPGQWNRRPKSEFRAAWEYLRAGLRMYPLADAA